MIEKGIFVVIEGAENKIAPRIRVNSPGEALKMVEDLRSCWKLSGIDYEARIDNIDCVDHDVLVLLDPEAKPTTWMYEIPFGVGENFVIILEGSTVRLDERYLRPNSRTLSLDRLKLIVEDMILRSNSQQATKLIEEV